MLDLNFDFSSIDFIGESAERAKEIPKLQTIAAAFENAEELANNIDYEKDYFCLLSGSFIFGDFIEALCYKKKLYPKEIYITTLGMSQENIDSIVNLVDYLGCRKVNLLVSHYFYGVERHKLVPYMMQEFSGKPVDVAVLQSHCKICIIYSDKGNMIITGSANMSSSNNVEQIVITHDETIINYCKERLDSIMDRFVVYKGKENLYTPKNNKNNTGKYAYRAMKGD